MDSVRVSIGPALSDRYSVEHEHEPGVAEGTVRADGEHRVRRILRRTRPRISVRHGVMCETEKHVCVAHHLGRLRIRFCPVPAGRGKGPEDHF